MHTGNDKFLEFKDPKEEMCKAFYAEKRNRRFAPPDYKIEGISDRRHHSHIVYFDARRMPNGNPIVLFRLDPTIDPPVIGGQTIELNDRFGNLKREKKNLIKYFSPIEGIPEFSFPTHDFILGNETSKGTHDQLPHLLYCEDLVDVHWRDTYDIKSYRQLMCESVMPYKYLSAYWARWFCKEKGFRFVGPIGKEPVDMVGTSMNIIDAIALPLTGS